MSLKCYICGTIMLGQLDELTWYLRIKQLAIIDPILTQITQMLNLYVGTFITIKSDTAWTIVSPSCISLLLF
jgi:hypothetical protein